MGQKYAPSAYAPRYEVTDIRKYDVALRWVAAVFTLCYLVLIVAVTAGTAAMVFNYFTKGPCT
jgi:hypothetical protein